uniref:Uncharacterized protein n=1 Tax=Spongospora subterranea TaxID=70186 RepID=A0A0H5RBW6_9EUKA|eukprot:CRZ11725.1 hypothetical protein [Spongospora subterranea]
MNRRGDTFTTTLHCTNAAATGSAQGPTTAVFLRHLPLIVIKTGPATSFDLLSPEFQIVPYSKTLIMRPKLRVARNTEKGVKDVARQLDENSKTFHSRSGRRRTE